MKLDKTSDDDVQEVFLEMLYEFDYDDYPIVFRKEYEIIDDKSLYQLLESAFEHLRNIAQIGLRHLVELVHMNLTLFSNLF